MATSREERMQQRMRGAGRHEVADDSFGFILPVAEDAPPAAEEASPEIPPPAPAIRNETALRTEPNTSAKRRRLSPDEPPVPTSPEKGSSASRASARLSASKARSSPAPPPRPPSASSQLRSSTSKTSTRLNPPRKDPYTISESGPSVADVLEDLQAQPAEEVEVEAEADDDELESLPAAMPMPGSHSSIISRLSAGPGIIEEVTESPAEAPGSGHRRRIRLSNVATQSARLQRAVMEEENGLTGEFTTSSPLARKARTSGATTGPLSTRSTRATAMIASSPSVQGIDGSSPTPRLLRRKDGTAASGSVPSALSQVRRSILSPILDEVDDVDELSSPLAAGTSSARKPQPRVRNKPVPEPPEPIEEEPGPDADGEEAEEIDDQEAARRIGRKRARASPPRGESPELNADPTENPEPARKKRQKRPQESPARQTQPKAPKSKPRKPARMRGDDGEAIPIIVQRYTEPIYQNENDGDADILAADIPFANRGGVNVIDVLAQMCDEVIESNLETLHKATAQAADAATRKEYRTKLRALEAFQEELRTRLLEHTIALDTMHALKKRVRSVQKEKLSLRSEIMRIRAEREQVALKMDAVRIRHERESKESLHILGLSSAMHDVELAIDNGKSAPELGPKEKKRAELANLELLVSRVADEASADGDGGGNLKQIKDFNAFLERAAAALEGR